MNDVRFISCGAKGCKYRWNWCSRTSCFKCGSKLGVSAVEPPAPRGVWSKPRGGEPGTWTEARSRCSRKWNKLGNDKIETTKIPADAARAPTKVEKLITLLQAAERADAGDEIITNARNKLEEAKSERDRATPPEKMRSRLSQKIREKEATAQTAREFESACKERLQKATADLEKAKEQVGLRLNELEVLRNDLADVDAEDEEDTFSCEGEDEQLDPAFRGDIEVVQLHRRLEAAKLRHRERHASQSVEAAKDGPAADATCATQRDGDNGCMELDEESWLEGDSLAFVKEQRAAMGDDKYLQLGSLLKGKGKGVRYGPYG